MKDEKHLDEYKKIRKELDTSAIPTHIYSGEPEGDKILNEKSVEVRKEALDRCILKHEVKKKKEDSFIG